MKLNRMLFIAVLLKSAALAQGTSGDSMEIKPGIPGPLRNFQLLPTTNVDELDANLVHGDLDLKRMAHWALNYLLCTPRPEENYQPNFGVWPLACPPHGQGWDTIVDGDTDCRMEWEYYYMRDISGCEEGWETEIKFHERIRNYLGDHDLCWTYIGCFDMDSSVEKTKAKGLIANIWSTSKVLKSRSLDYERHHNPQDKDTARRIFAALRSLACWTPDKKAAYLPGGMGPLGKDLKPVSSGWGIHPAPIIEPLLCYWKATGDSEALEFAKAYAEGIITNARPGNIVRINEDGSFAGHMHATLHATWGITRLGCEIQDPRYIEFTRRIYEFVLKKHSAYTGWIHEAVSPAPDSVINSGETCATSDMMSMVSWLAQADRFMPGQGLADYYDHLERYLRNYIAITQFFITPQFEAFYREKHKDLPKEKVDAGLEMLRKFEGGFVGGVGINDFMNDFLKDTRTSFNMQGCCVPEGMRALWTTWNSILNVEVDGDGRKSVFVNMSLPREAPEAAVISYLPNVGRVDVKVKQLGDFYLRPPAWVPREMVKAWRSGKPVDLVWMGSYVKFINATPGETLIITYPLASYEQEVRIWPDPGKTVINPEIVAKFFYKGNWVVACDPPGNHFPFYTGRLPKLPESDPLLPE